MEVFLDESNYTGENLFNPDQPFFVLASTNLSDMASQDLHRDLFSDIRAKELKHSTVSKYTRQRERVVRLVRELASMTKKPAMTYVVHKRFALLAKLVDFWLESALHETGHNLYANGGAVAFANMAYICLDTFESKAFLDGHLARFEKMMREKSSGSYMAFWDNLAADLRECRAESAQIIDFLLTAERILGPRHLTTIPKRPLDVAFPAALQTVHAWRRITTDDLHLTHDQSSTMAKEQWLWDEIVSPHSPPAKLAFDERMIEFPLRVTGTVFAQSENHIQLQICDLIAGATVARLRYIGTQSELAEYAAQLEDAGILDLMTGGIWPTDQVEPLGDPEPGAEDPIEYLIGATKRASAKQTS